MTSKLEELIAELCPNGVEYKKIGDIKKDKAIRLISPSLKIKSNDYKNEGSVPIISQELEFISGYSDVFDPNIPNSEYVCFGDHSEHIKYVNFAFAQGADGLKIISVNNEVMLAKYFYYAISNYYVKHNNYERHFKYLIDTEIPVPPLEVQAEIVRILDTFTELTAELTAELTDRKKQYEYYRDTLLTFDDNNPLHSFIQRYCPNGVEYKKIGDIATDVFRGYGIKKDQVTSTGIPCVRYGEIYTKYNLWFDSCFSHTDESLITNKKYFEHGDILFAITGESVEDIAKSCAYVGNEKCLAGGDIVVVKHNQNPKYLSYALSTTDARLQKSSGKVKSKVVHASTESIKGITIPVPPLEVQHKIVQILDRFDALCNDLTQGLPAEIEARRKQYEYYRDQLLTFKRA